MKKIFLILLIIGAIFTASKLGVFNEPEELQKSRENYQEIYGEKAKYFIFSK